MNEKSGNQTPEDEPYGRGANWVRMDTFQNRWFRRGRPAIVELCWIFFQAIFVSSSLPGSAHRKFLLRLFGAKLGKGVVVKPRFRVKFPWRLEVGNHSWLGEDVWIDNLAEVKIGSHCCLSQGAFLCTGSHDWSLPSFDLIVKPITLEHGAWVAAKSVVSPGVTLHEGAVLALGSVAISDLKPWSVYIGTPAVFQKVRENQADSSNSQSLQGANKGQA